MKQREIIQEDGEMNENIAILREIITRNIKDEDVRVSALTALRAIKDEIEKD